MEKVGNPVPAQLLYLLIVVREFLEEFVFSGLQHSFTQVAMRKIKTPSETKTVSVVTSGVKQTLWLLHWPLATIPITVFSTILV